MLAWSSLYKRSALWKTITQPMYLTGQHWSVKMTIQLSQVYAMQHRARVHLTGEWESTKNDLELKLVFFFKQCHHCFSTGVVLTKVPYAQNKFYTVSSLLQCRRSKKDVWRVTSFVCEKCRLKDMQHMIHIFIHWASGYTKQRHTGEKKSVVVMVYVPFICTFRVYASKGRGVLSTVDCRLNLSHQWHVHLRAYGRKPET